MARIRHLVTAADPAGRYGEPEPLPAHGTPQTQLVHRGAELVALSERFYHAIFIAGLGFVSASTIAALAFLPLRASARDAPVPVSTIVAALSVLALAGLATWRAHDVYRLLRRTPQLELVPVLVAAVLLSVASPHRNELWWPACAILMALSLLLSLRRALGYCLLVLAANLTAHVIAGDLRELSAVDTVGLWVGLPFWTALTVVVPDRMASHILRLNAVRTPPPGRPLAVNAWTTDAAAPTAEGGQPGTEPPEPPVPPEPPEPPEPGSASGAPDALPRTLPAAAVTPHRADRLTSRQLQVVALLADGYRYRVIAACLGISAAQVHRHVTHAVARLGVRSVNELVALTVAEGIVPPPHPRPGD